MENTQPEFILNLEAKISKEDYDAIQEAMNTAYMYGYYAHMREVCQHSFFTPNKGEEDICSKCGIAFSVVKSKVKA